MSLENLKVGDLVLVDTRHAKAIRKVERITKTKILIENRGGFATEFRRQNGYAFGERGYWFRTTIRPASEELIAQVREEIFRKNSIAKLCATEWHKLPSETLKSLLQILQNPE